MATKTPKSTPLAILLLILLTATSSFPIPTTSSSFFSLSHSLLTRVANLRSSRGDVSGSIRLKSIADRIEKHSRGFSFYGVMWSLGWDYFKNYAWRDVETASFQMFGVVSDLNEFIRVLNELDSDVDRVDWVRRNYATLLNLSNSLFNRLLKVFTHSGPLKDAVEMVRTEIVDGGLLRDCLELGSNDLKGLMQMLKDVALKYPYTSYRTEL